MRIYRKNTCITPLQPLLRLLRENVLLERAGYFAHQRVPRGLYKGYLTEDILDVAQRLNPYGESNPPLVFLAKKLVIKTLDVVGQKEVGHIRFSLDAGKNIWPAIYWNSSDRAGRDLNVGDTVDAIFRVDYNYFRNKTTPQLVIIDMEKSPK